MPLNFVVEYIAPFAKAIVNRCHFCWLGGRCISTYISTRPSCDNRFDGCSAPPLAPLTTFGSLRKPNSKGSSPVPSYPQSPTSPLNDIDQMGVLSSALNPEDRGKATAMGAFNKPAQQFDEQQYLERQRQLQHSMDNAAQRRPSVGKFAPRKNSIDNFAPRRPSVDHFAPRRPSVNSPAQRQNSVDDLVQRKNSVDISDQSVQARLVRCEQGPDRANSRASQRARSQSASRQSQRPLQSQSPQTQPQPQQELEQEPEPELQVQAQPESSASAAFSVFQNAALQMRAAQGNLQHPSSHATHEIPDTHKTFFGDISASDSEDEDVQEISRQPGHGFYSNAYSNGPVGGRFPGTMLPSVFEHPALRSHGSAFNIIEEEEDIPEVPPLRPTPSARSLQTDTATIPAPTPEEQEIDSPTMGMNDAALSGLVHQHLRNDSNQSSIYPDRKSVHPMPPPQPSVPSLSDATSRNTRYTVDSDRRINSSYTNSNPWDLEEFDGGYYYGEQDTRSPVSPVDSNKSRNNLASASSKPNVHADRASTALRDSEPLEGAWQAELKRQHTRDASTATQQEREAFDNELAARQQAIQEKLKNMVESQSRGVSPVPSVSGALKAFGMLKRRDSRESMANPQDGASAKAMKMLGIGSSNPVGSSTTSLQNQHDRYHGYEESRPDTAMTNRTNGYLPNASAQRTPPTRRDRSQSRPRGDSETSTTGNMRVRGPMPPQPNANQSRSRSRSNSAVSAGRSRSRTGRYRDDLDKAMKEGMASSASGLPELSQQLTPRPSPEMYQYSSPPLEGQGRARSNSKHATPGYFEAKNLQPIQTMGNPRLTPGGLTPATLSHATFHSASSGIGSPYPNANTPPLSAATTPVMQASEIMPKVPNMPPIEKNKPLLRKRQSTSLTSQNPR
ncbi:hypothetical protein H2203_000888 [Taxawa tesnikishii (nom. ined.)]|nr:hypothetical protein H2203_000888 [Dothideales sp. JES 119]